MKQTRRSFLKTTGLGAAALTAPTFFSSCSKKSSPPNILYIMSDDHAEQAISCYGSKLIQTPNIDRIADQGVRFDNSFVTNSICAPSRAVLLTGKYSHINGLRDNRDVFDGNQVTFPKLLQKTGYQTFVVGKWHLKSEPTGFDEWKILKGQGVYYNPVLIENGEEKQLTGYTTDLLTDKALDILENRDKSKPFCMLMHHKAPHRNWMPNSKYLGAFDDKELPIPETLFDDYDTRTDAAKTADMRIDDMFLSYDLKLNRDAFVKDTGTGGSKKSAPKVVEGWFNSEEKKVAEQSQAWRDYYDKVSRDFKKANLKGKELLKWKYRRYMQDYLSCILSVDESVGRLLDYLDKENLADNTVVVYTSDQGFYLGEHGWFDKRFMYEESLSMPLLMRYPADIKPGQVVNNMVLNLDFAPTFLDFAGVAAPNEMQGKSLRPILEGQSPADWRKEMYYHYYEFPHGWHDVKRHYGIRTEQYKLIHFYHDIDAWELYDLKKDPNEVNNLYNDPAYKDVVVSLTKQLKALQEKYGDTNIVID